MQMVMTSVTSYFEYEICRFFLIKNFPFFWKGGGGGGGGGVVTGDQSCCKLLKLNIQFCVFWLIFY